MRLALAAAFALALVSGSAASAMGVKSQDPADAPAGTWVLDKTHASVTAKVKHMGFSDYTMRFDKFDASYTYDPAKPEASQINVTLDANSLDVGDPKVSAQFAKEFLAADKAPTVTFASTAIHRDDPAHGTVTGDLTFRGVTKPVTLTLTFNGVGGGMMPGSHRAGFSGTATIKRSDFGSDYLQGIVGDEVNLLIEAEFTPK